MIEKAKLAGGPEKTLTRIWFEDSQLKVEYYDFSDEAHRLFGNDIAYTITVNEMDKLFSGSSQNEASLIEWVTGNYSSYFDVKKWLEDNEIDFEREIESWA